MLDDAFLSLNAYVKTHPRQACEIALVLTSVLWSPPHTASPPHHPFEPHTPHHPFSISPTISPHSTSQVRGCTLDPSGRQLATLAGKWDQSLHYVEGDLGLRQLSAKEERSVHLLHDAKLLWQGNQPSPFARNYKFTPFCVQLNEITEDIKVRRGGGSGGMRPGMEEG